MLDKEDTNTTPSLRPAVQTNNLDPQRVKDFINRIKAFDGIRIPLKTLLELFATVFPPRPREIEMRRWLLAALEQAETEGVIHIPPSEGKRWDRTLHPPIPLSVDRIAPPKATRIRTWQTFRWHPKLAWVGDLLHINPEQETFLLRVHQGLVNDEFAQLAPLKRRSLELTGDEKRLSTLMRTTLFRRDRLSLDLLGCVPNYPQLAIENVGHHPTMIVFENIEPFHVACKVLTQMPHPPYGMVAFGAGTGFVRSIITLTKYSIEHIDYVGDLDAPGLRIARSAGLKACELGLPPLRPAEGIHRTMLNVASRFKHPLGFPYKKAPRSNLDETLVDWLPVDMQAAVLSILKARNRIAEEILAENDMVALWQAA